jgi:hypothetical protein
MRWMGYVARKRQMKNVITIESPTAQREQVRKIHNINFRHLGILL